MSQAFIGRRTYQVAGRFAELKPRQLLAIVHLLHAKLTLLDLKMHLALVLLDARRRPLLCWQLLRMSNENRHELTKLAGFCLEEPRLTQQLLPVLRIPGRLTKLHGPASTWANLSYGEFIQAEGHFADYQRHPDQTRHLDQLVATLYRPAGGDDAADCRQPYAQRDVAKRVPLVARLPLATRLAVRMWYASCRAAYVRKYTGTLFTSDEKNGTRPRDPREVWREILAERAGSPVHYDEYSRQLMPNIFFDLDLRIRRRQEETPKN
ncbi:MAG: hypothetical protein ACRYFZ_16120 [Janthinobacterium lividum]